MALKNGKILPVAREHHAERGGHARIVHQVRQPQHGRDRQHRFRKLVERALYTAKPARADAEHDRCGEVARKQAVPDALSQFSS